MFEAARNTEHRGGWGDKQLRNTRINFVTASAAEMSFQQESEEDDAGDNEDDNEGSLSGRDSSAIQKSRPNIEPDVDAQPSAGSSRGGSSALRSDIPQPDQRDHDNGPQSNLDDGSSFFFIDTEGDGNLKPTMAPAAAPTSGIAETDGNDSDSSEEIIVFKGRNANINARQESPRRAQAVRVIEDNVRSIHLDGGENNCRMKDRTSGITHDRPSDHQADGPGNNEAMNDYVANILAQEQDVRHLEAFANASIQGRESRPRSMMDTDDATEADSDLDNEEDSDDDDDDDDDLSEADIDSEDEAPDESKLDNAALAMTDEQLARRLAKQEELGLGSNEVLLWAEDDMAGVAEEEGEEFSLEVLRHVAQKLSGKQSKRSKRGNKSLLPEMLDDLDLMNDDYRDFDILDFERPSVQRRGKGSKDLPFHLSDSELEANMINAWENDRAKKKKRKVERELLRSQGLIGGGENIKLRSKYPTGIGASEISAEIKEFLDSDNYQLSLIPMDKRLRKAVHDIANKLNLRSKSKGSGFDRYPCLFKTVNTLPFDGILIDATLRRYGGGKGPGRFTGASGRGPRSEKTRRNRGGASGGVTSGVSYRDGETVGASAPALGIENRGHAMLAKMGWTTGTALGALDNKGSLEPVAHVVKATRAGLG